MESEDIEDGDVVTICLDVDTVVPFLNGVEGACVGNKTRERLRTIEIKTKQVVYLKHRINELEKHVIKIEDTFIEILNRLEKIDDKR